MTREFIVVDNDSTDGTVNVAKEYGAKIIFLPSETFSWGRALNCGIEAATGEMVLLLSADASPADKNWIVEMIAPFKDIQVAAVYGRQIPRDNAPLDEIVRLRKTFPKVNIEYNITNTYCSQSGQIIASNACAAIRQRVWQLYRFDELTGGAEELPWVHDVLTAGYKILYSANAVVFHSHNDTVIRNAFRRIELWKEDCNRQNTDFYFIKMIRFLLIYIKKRLLNAVDKEVPFLKRISGLFLLPCEIFTLLVIYFLLSIGLFKTFRRFAWN
jgi:glycosyltransferase involved in cell wall biosynthesis